MKLHTSIGAPNPRRVNMFLLEKGITHIERQNYDLNAGEHRSAKFTAMNPIARVPVLELDDGRFLAESRAILMQCVIEGMAIRALREPDLDFEKLAPALGDLFDRLLAP